MKSAFLLSKGLLCLYEKQNNTWLLVEMEFLFSCSTQHLTRSLRSLASYRVKHSKRNSISTRAVYYSLFIQRQDKFASVNSLSTVKANLTFEVNEDIFHDIKIALTSQIISKFIQILYSLCRKLFYVK